MAGEWLKFESSLPEKPETLAITAAMGWDDPDLTVGKLMRVFRWFDQQTVDGNARGVTPALLDRIIGVTGFVQAMANARWIVIDTNGLSLQNFDRHNGETAKSRALTAKRVANHRASKASAESSDSNESCNATTVTPALAREEKRREEEKTSIPRAARRCPKDFVVSDEMRSKAIAACPGIDIDRETEKFRDHTFGTPRSDWPATWRNWMREARDRKPQKVNGSQPSFRDGLL